MKSHTYQLARRVVAYGLLAALVQGAAAQDLLDLGPRGLTDSPVPARVPPAQLAAPLAPQPAVEIPPPPLPQDPTQTTKPVMFGSQIFSGRFAANQGFSGFNAEHQLAPGDRVLIRLWGAVNHEFVQTVDAQGNIFLQGVGPVRVAGVRNTNLNTHVETFVKRTYRASVGVYAALEAAQPVKVYVSGFVRAPGLFSGLSSDSVLHYLDRAGGIDPMRGSFLEVDILRAGKRRARVDLYRFLLDGHIEPLQLQDGDTIVVAPRKFTVQVRGEALNPYVFEFGEAEISADRLLRLARPKPIATHMSIVRRSGAERRSEYHALADAAQVKIRDGDEVAFTSDKYPGTILVRFEGAHLGQRTVVLPYGSKLKDALTRMRPAPQANVAAVQLFRASVAERQRALMESSLQRLEAYALTARSATSEEAALRVREGTQILEFVNRARKIEPKGQVVISRSSSAPEMLLEDGDILNVPEDNQLILVNGEVQFPTAVVHEPRASIAQYIQRAGGYSQTADKSRIVVLHRDGSVEETSSGTLQPGDELMVLPKIETKNVEVARGITQIIYQIAVAAKVVFGL